ncbi:hypothetical protein R1sor_009076 [Riccia sorocarpa]|uniref:Uncharacterized protein n=1 Tax=Riccia sorocarpa TaxID=122646 RepID=A0ABD3H7K7_9MARC
MLDMHLLNEQRARDLVQGFANFPAAYGPAHGVNLQENQIPSSQPTEEESSDQPVEEQDIHDEEPWPRARRRRVQASGNARPLANGTSKSWFHWHQAATIPLVEVKKEKHEAEDAAMGCENLVSADVKWARIEKLARHKHFLGKADHRVSEAS